MGTPVNKGNFSYCEHCIYKLPKIQNDEVIKYPCSKSHRQVKQSDNCKYTRYFKQCNLYQCINGYSTFEEAMTDINSGTTSMSEVEYKAMMNAFNIY